jgi:hypothetical protein
MAATGLFIISTLFTSSLFPMITTTTSSSTLGFTGVIEDDVDNSYDLIQQASAQEENTFVPPFLPSPQEQEQEAVPEEEEEQQPATRNETAATTPPLIDFESISANKPGTPAASIVSTQYGDKGITFNNAVPLDYSDSPGFAHSGTKAIEQCYGKEFCTTPFEMKFTTAQNYIKVWVGYRGSLAEERTVVLRAFDAGGVQVSQATATLQPNTASQSISTPLEITTQTPNIIRATVSFSPDTILMNSLALDDIEFGAAGPSPLCASTRNPTVTLTQPANGFTAQRNEFILQGAVNTQAPLEKATLTVIGTGSIDGNATTGQEQQQQPQEKSLNLLDSLIPPEELGNFGIGPSRINELLSPGSNIISVTVQDCHGSSESNKITVNYTPFSTDTRFVFLGMDVTQADNSYSAGSFTAGKLTSVRIYLSLQSESTKEIKDVSGFLSAHRPDPSGDIITTDLGESVPPYRLLSLNSITVDSSTDINAKRGDFTATLNFQLPPEWIIPGTLHLSFTPLINGEDTDLDCDDPKLESRPGLKGLGCENFNIYGFPAFIHFLISRADCLIWAVGEYNIRIAPDPKKRAWDPVISDDPVVVEGVVTNSKVTYTDYPYNHNSHDWNFHVKPDSKYDVYKAGWDRKSPFSGLAGIFSPFSVLAGIFDVRQQLMEMEWETRNFPPQFWPMEGDRVWMMGRYVWDCGHVPLKTEIHPPEAVAFTRQEPVVFTVDGVKDPSPSLASKTYIYIHGRGGYYDTPVGGEKDTTYEFDISLPPKPSPTAEPYVEVLEVPFGGVRPTLTLIPTSSADQKVHVVYPLSSVPPSPDNKFGAVVAAGWREQTPSQSYHELEVTFNSILINDNKDNAEGEWKLWASVNGKWIELLGGPIDDNDSFSLVESTFLTSTSLDLHKTIRVTVPDNGNLTIVTTGWERDAADGFFGVSTRVGAAASLLIDNNDEITNFIAEYTKADNFNIGTHDISSPVDNPDFSLSVTITEGRSSAGGGDTVTECDTGEHLVGGRCVPIPDCPEGQVWKLGQGCVPISTPGGTDKKTTNGAPPRE